jgi:glycogen debranching enzyme
MEGSATDLGQGRPAEAPPGPEPSPSAIAAAESLQERRLRTMKHGDTFAVFDHSGDALNDAGSPEGIFHRDTRHLSHFQLTVEGRRPMLLSSTVRDDNAVLSCDLSNPDIKETRDGEPLSGDLLHIRRTRFVWDARVFERIALSNFDTRPRRISIEITFRSDFADIFEVRGTPRARRGEVLGPTLGPGSVTLAYVGLDNQRRETRLQFEPAPDTLGEEEASFSVALEPGERRSLFVEVRCGIGYGERSARRAFFTGLRDARRELRLGASRAASVSTSNEVFNDVMRRAVSDLYMLLTETPNGPYPYAGIPWFSTVFGRDALITALETLWMDPAIARGVLRHLAAHQATEADEAADAEPGKILHEVRLGEMAELGEVPFRCYYGSVDSTPLFVVLAGAYLERTDDVETVLGIWRNIEAALSWLDTEGDRDGDGFIEYGRRNATGLVNQGWKDSNDSVFHEDGTLATGPVAMVEVQAYAYGAWRAAAAIAQRLNRPADQVAALNRRADELQRRFDQAFFDEALGTYVLALDGAKRPCRVRSSNAGHALFTGIARPERAEKVVGTLMQRSSFTGWGIRTVPTTEARYNPMSYHNGSVWPHDNALIAAGMARYGHRMEAMQIFKGLFEASTHIDLHRLPELFCGFPRLRSHGPTFYPVACSPQAWAAGAILSLVQTCLGLSFDPKSGSVVLDHPVLPEFLESATLRQLWLPAGRIEVALAQARKQAAVHVISRTGDVIALVRT